MSVYYIMVNKDNQPFRWGKYHKVTALIYIDTDKYARKRNNIMEKNFMHIERNLLDQAAAGGNALLFRALSSEIRLNILRLLAEQGLTIAEIAKKLYLSVSSATFHVKLLAESGIVDISFLPSKKGKVQVCRLKTASLYFYFSKNEHSAAVSKMTAAVPVGHYTDAKLDFVSGFCTKDAQCLFDDGNLFRPERAQAELLWCQSGFVEYAFSNTFPEKKVNEITFSVEICSETLGYQNEWKSDITFSLNNTELLTWTSPGDFGDRRGRLNPAWWPDTATQYGCLKKLSIKTDGVYLDGNLVNRGVNLELFALDRCDKLRFRIENKENAEHKGGFNLFGKAFGDFPQDIVLTAVFANHGSTENE